MDTNALLLTLCSQITPVERSALRNNNVAHISQHNRNTLLHMLEMEEQNPVPVDTARAKALHAALRDYLNRYMPETPEAHKWIIIKYPLHPQSWLSGEDYETWVADNEIFIHRILQEATSGRIGQTDIHFTAGKIEALVIKGRALIAYSEAMSAMGDRVDEVTVRLFSYGTEKNIPLFYTDMVGISSNISEDKKELALELANVLISEEVLTEMSRPENDDDYPQYLLVA